MFDDHELMRLHREINPDNKYPPVGGWPAPISAITDNERQQLQARADEQSRSVMMYGGRGDGKNADYRQMAIGEMVQFLQRNGYKVTKRKR